MLRINAKKIIAISLVLVSAVVFAPKVHASDGKPLLLYYYAEDEEGQEIFKTQEFIFDESFTEDQKAFILFGYLFDERKKYISHIPADTDLIGCRIKEDTMVVNVSKEINDYGGSYNELAMIKQLAKNAQNFKGVTKLTILIEYNPDSLPEGQLVQQIDIEDIMEEGELIIR